MTKVKVKFKKLCEAAELPKYAHDGDIGMDVKAVRMEYDEDTDTYIYYTGLACETDSNVGILGFLRSSNYNTDCYLTNGVGLIDSATYRGEIQFRFKNRTSMADFVDIAALDAWAMTPWYKKIFTSYRKVYKRVKEYYYEYPEAFAPYAIGDRLGQFVIIKFPEVEIEMVEELSETTRGEKGHGSTGK